MIDKFTLPIEVFTKHALSPENEVITTVAKLCGWSKFQTHNLNVILIKDKLIFLLNCEKYNALINAQEKPIRFIHSRPYTGFWWVSEKAYQKMLDINIKIADTIYIET